MIKMLLIMKGVVKLLRNTEVQLYGLYFISGGSTQRDGSDRKLETPWWRRLP